MARSSKVDTNQYYCGLFSPKGPTAKALREHALTGMNLILGDTVISVGVSLSVGIFGYLSSHGIIIFFWLGYVHKLTI